MPKTPKSRKPSRAEREFYEAYGRAIAEWAVFEYCLSQLFAQVTDMHPTVAVRVFFAARTSQARLEMLSKALPAQAAHPDTLGAIKELVKKAGQYNETRNKLAHEYAIPRLNLETGEVEHVLANTAKLNDPLTNREQLSGGLTTQHLKEIEKGFRKLAEHSTNLALGFGRTKQHGKDRDTIHALPNLPYTPCAPAGGEARKSPRRSTQG
jgi:hypothetical protein